jgi:hypothetical protein
MSIAFFFPFRRLVGARVAPLSPLFLLHLRRCHLRCYFWFPPPFSFKGSANARADFFWRVRVWELAFFPSSPFVQFFCALLSGGAIFAYRLISRFADFNFSWGGVYSSGPVFHHPRSFSFFALFFPGVLFLVFPFLLSPLGSRKR